MEAVAVAHRQARKGVEISIGQGAHHLGITCGHDAGDAMLEER